MKYKIPLSSFIVSFILFTLLRKKNYTIEDNSRVGGINAIIEKTKFFPVYSQLPSADGHNGKTNLRAYQKKTGVYIIKENDKIVYVGAGTNIYKNALRHFEPNAGNFRANPKNKTFPNRQDYYSKLRQNDYTIRLVVCNTSQQAFNLEAALIKAHDPRDNDQTPELYDEEIYYAYKDARPTAPVSNWESDSYYEVFSDN